MKTPKARILVVEDDAPILGGLMDVLVFNGFEVEGVPDGSEGLEKALSGTYDLLLLDIMLPHVDGLTICQEVREKKPDQPVIMLTAKGSENDVVAGFKAGADDYVSKPFSLRELMVRVEAVLRRSGKSLGDERIVWGEVVFDGLNLTAVRGAKTEELTRREMDIISYLHHYRDRIVSKRELLEKVWNYADPDVETRTVDIHMLKLRRKIAALIGETPLITTVRGEGYRLEPEP